MNSDNEHSDNESKSKKNSESHKSKKSSSHKSKDIQKNFIKENDKKKEEEKKEPPKERVFVHSRRKIEPPKEEPKDDLDAYIPRGYSEATTKIGHHVDTCCKPREQRLHEKNDIVVVCWRCSELNLVNKNWEMIECSGCHALCRIPQKVKKENILSRYGYDYERVKYGRMVAPRFTAIVCPFCKYENKVDLRAKSLMCLACNSIWDIERPDQNPPEEYCDSVNPESHYYKFKPEFRKDAQYPPKYSIGVSDLFFPDPVMYNDGAPYPQNPFADYALPYQEMLSFRRANKFMEHQNKIRKDLKGKYGIHKGDKEKFYKITGDLMKKIDKSIKDNNYMAYVSNDDQKSAILNKTKNNRYSDFEVENKKGRLASSDKYMKKRNSEKNKLIETMFLMN